MLRYLTSESGKKALIFFEHRIKTMSTHHQENPSPSAPNVVLLLSISQVGDTFTYNIDFFLGGTLEKGTRQEYIRHAAKIKVSRHLLARIMIKR